MMSPNHLTIETPSQLRTIRCGLPPLLPFPPDPTDTSIRNIEHSHSNEGKSRGRQLWAKQSKEQELMNTANRRIRWILTRLGSHINSLESVCDERDLFPYNHSRGEENDACRLTVFDLNCIARKLNGLSCEFDILLEPREKLESTSEEVEGAAYFRYWNETISVRFPDNNIPLCWSAVLAIPLEEVASDILALYEVNSDNKSNGEGIRNYLQYQAAETLRNVQELALPSVKHRLKQKQTLHHKMQMTQKEFANRYNKTFELWDEYCTNVLRVESDTLPLCPRENEDSLDNYETTTDSYAKDISKCAFEPLRQEFRKLSDRFVKLLTGVSMESSGERRYYGQSISHGITYYRRFIEFILSSQDIKNHEQLLDREREVPLETLYQFTTEISSTDNHHGATCFSQFINSPAVRAKLVSDLRQLDAFLSCRRREISKTSSRGFGHTLAEAIDIEWTQFCIRGGANDTAGHWKVSSDDVIRFQEATSFVLTQILGDGAHAKRLRLLADVVGYTSSDEATSREPFSWHFNVLCQKAANLSRQMAFYEQQANRMTMAVLQLETEIELIQEKVRVMENRVACICDGLKAQ
ncbi:hypothetical protein ACHAW6_007330 [Cyclotella cf. meneghiniana]